MVGNEMGKNRDPIARVGSHALDVRNPEKYPDCRTDLIGGAATQTFAPGGKYPRDATVAITVLFTIL